MRACGCGPLGRRARRRCRRRRRRRRGRAGSPPRRDRQVVERRGEVPVGEQEAADDGDDRRQHTTDESDDHRQHEVQQQHARQPHLVAEVGEEERHERQADDGEHPSPRLAAGRQRRQHRLDVRQAPARALIRFVRRPGDDVHVDRSGQAHDTVDHGPAEQLLPARAVARSEHDLGGVLRSGEVDQRRGDVVAGHLAVLAAELLEQPALLGDRPLPPARRART